MTNVSNSEDILDSRDIIKRIEELEALIAADDGGELADDAPVAGEDEREELRVLKALEEEASGYSSDWSHGEALIRDSYFTRYAQQLADDIGALDRHVLRWPLTCIDWEAAAKELQQDYTSVDYDGVEYWIRSC